MKSPKSAEAVTLMRASKHLRVVVMHREDNSFADLGWFGDMNITTSLIEKSFAWDIRRPDKGRELVSMWCPVCDVGLKLEVGCADDRLPYQIIMQDKKRALIATIIGVILSPIIITLCILYLLRFDNSAPETGIDEIIVGLAMSVVGILFLVSFMALINFMMEFAGSISICVEARNGFGIGRFYEHNIQMITAVPQAERGEAARPSFSGGWGQLE